jgi:hypothetical protein
MGEGTEVILRTSCGGKPIGIIGQFISIISLVLGIFDGFAC